MTRSQIHPDLLRSYAAISEAGSFTGAARLLGLRQSTVSQHVKRLEEITRRRLLDRDTHRVRITPDGEVMLDLAHRVLEAQDRMARFLFGAPLRGRLRFGASEDFVLSALPDVLASFVRRHPEVDIELTAGLSADLHDRFDVGELDFLFVKRRVGDRRGLVAWREPIAWIARSDYRVDADTALPLLLYPSPSVTRALALETLDSASRPWRVAFTSGSLTGLSAAARAGIGVMPHSIKLLPPGLAALAPTPNLPQLPDIEFVIVGPGGRNPVAEALTAAIQSWAAFGRTTAPQNAGE
jgi:DNA-binding transcriptional LysR family regulator